VNHPSHKAELRQYLRQLIRTRRNELTDNEQAQAAHLLKERLIRHEKVISAKRIAIYLANEGELDPKPFIQWCWQHNKEVYLPVLHPFCKGHLLFLRYKPDTQMSINQYGIEEPALDVTQICPIEQLDVLCTPLVAFDTSGARLGMGGGFYDRTLSGWFHRHSLNTQAKPYPIGIAHDCQQVEQVPSEHWDVPIPEIITPSMNHVPGKWSISHHSF